jgi:hypothetical protein
VTKASEVALTLAMTRPKRSFVQRVIPCPPAERLAMRLQEGNSRGDTTASNCENRVPGPLEPLCIFPLGAEAHSC